MTAEDLAGKHISGQMVLANGMEPPTYNQFRSATLLPQAIAAINEALERAALEADYFANHSLTAKTIAKNIRALKS